MKKFIKWTSAIISLVGIGMFVEGNDVIAEESHSVIITPELPKSQRDDINGYFSIDWAKGLNNDFGIKFKNNTNGKVDYDIDFNKGVTNENGMIVYDDSSQNEGSPLVNDWVEFPDKVSVEPGEEKVVKGTIKLPDENMVGQELAGFFIHDSKDVDDVDQGTVAQTKSYAIPFAVRGNEKSDKSELTFDKFGVRRVSARGFAITVPIKSETPTISNVGTRRIIIKENNGEEIFNKEDSLSLAPLTKTSLAFPINFPLEDMEYTVTIQLSSNFGDFEETQVVRPDKEVLKEMNQVFKTGNESDNTLIYILAGVIVLLIIILVVFMTKKKKEDYE